MCNNFFQYSFAKIISQKYGLNLKCSPILDFRCKINPKEYNIIKENVLEYDGNVDILDDVFLAIEKGEISREGNFKIIYHHSIEDPWFYKPYLDEIRTWFYPIKKENYNDVVLHYRLGDFLNKAGRTMSPDKYIKLLDTLEFRKLYILTDDPSNKTYLDPFKKYNSEIVSTYVRRDVTNPDLKATVGDFNFMRKFDRIIFGNSTYGWWASVLSQASEVYFYKNGKGSNDKSKLGETDYKGGVGF